MKLTFIRHGDPDYENDALTEQGVMEAKLLAPRIPGLCAKEYYMSPLGRAQQTARLALEGTGIEPEVLWWLEEFSPRVFRPDRPERGGVAWDWLPQDWTVIDEMYQRDKWFLHPAFQEVGVFDRHQKVTEEFDAFLEKHGYVHDGRMYKAVSPNNDTIVFFCHFGLETLLLAHLIGISPMILWQGFCAAPTSVTTVASEERTSGNVQWRCICYGDNSHLYAAGVNPGFSGRFCECYTNTDERHI